MASASPRWLSDDPSKAWAERFFLLYTPAWIGLMAIVVVTGAYRHFGEVGYMLLGFAAGAPAVVVPIFWVGEADRGRPWHERSWVKLNLWIAIFVWIGSYFLTHYFFDVLGMVYLFENTWTLDAALVGSGRDEVPAFLYPLTHAYFISYHTAMTVLLRYLGRRFGPSRVARAATIVVLAYVVAFLETFLMATDFTRDVFQYADRGRMLAFGSIFYACYFIVSLPMYARVDEGGPWQLGRTAIDALGAGMIVFIILDAWALALGPMM